MVDFRVGAEKIQDDNTILIWHYQKVRKFERERGKNERRKNSKGKKKRKKRHCVEKDTGQSERDPSGQH